jgi:DNA primase
VRRRSRGPVPGNVPAALDELGIDYTIRGDEAQARCPNPEHHDRKPSWSCNLITGDHNCFACGFGGPFAWLVAKVRGLDEGEATAWVRKRGGVERARSAREDREPRQVRVYTEADLALFDTPPGWALRERHLTTEAAGAYGVLWDRAQQYWILPIRDPSTGKLWGWQEKGDDYFNTRPKGVAKSETLFGYHLLQPGCRAVLVESPLDAVRILAAGIPYAVASFGAELSDTQLQLILDRCSGLVCAHDNDNAGWKQAAWLKEHTRRNVRLHYFDYTDTTGKDPGELTDDAIRRGVTRAYAASRARF